MKTTENADNDLYKVQLSKPYIFEGETYTEIDLSGCDELTGNDAAKAEKILTARRETSVIPEMSASYAFVIASLGTGKPLEFFFGLPLKDAARLKQVVRSTFL